MKNKERVELFKQSVAKDGNATQVMMGVNNFERQRKTIEFSTYMEAKYPPLKEDPAL